MNTKKATNSFKRTLLLKYFTFLVSLALTPLLLSCVGANTARPVAQSTIVVTVDDSALDNQDSVYSFGVVQVAEISNPATFTITNEGVDPLRISGNVILYGEDTSQFSIDTQPDALIAAGGSSTFTATFRPTSAGTKRTSIVVYSNDQDNLPFAFAVVGTNSLATLIDGGRSNGINKDPDQTALYSVLAQFSEKLYAAWRESNGFDLQIRVAVYNGDNDNPAWSFVDGDGINGINKDPTQFASQPQLAVLSNKLYAIWTEMALGAAYQIRAAVYNGNDSIPSWNFVDGNGASGINKDFTKTALRPHIEVFASKLYASWYEPNGLGVEQIRVAVYNGNDSSPAWAFVDGNGASGINKDSTKIAQNPELIAFNSKLYASWQETDGAANQIRVAVYNGNDSSPSWSFVDEDGITGINKDTSKSAFDPALVSYNSKLYASWYESNGTKYQIRAIVFNGADDTPVWTFVDGNGTNGINKDTDQDATSPRLVIHNSTLYATWHEANATAVQIRMAVYGGNDASPTWSIADGNQTYGINKDTAKDAYVPDALSFDSRIYFTWAENNGTAYQIRASRMNY